MNFAVLNKWKQFVEKEELKSEQIQPKAKEQENSNSESDDDDDLDVGDEESIAQKVYSSFEIPQAFYLDYVELK